MPEFVAYCGNLLTSSPNNFYCLRMLIRLIFTALLMIPLSGISQVVDTMYFDRNWEQSARPDAYYYRIISIDTSGDFRFHVADYYPDKQVQMTGTYKSIRPDNKDGHFT